MADCTRINQKSRNSGQVALPLLRIQAIVEQPQAVRRFRQAGSHLQGEVRTALAAQGLRALAQGPSGLREALHQFIEPALVSLAEPISDFEAEGVNRLSAAGVADEFERGSPIEPEPLAESGDRMRAGVVAAGFRGGHTLLNERRIIGIRGELRAGGGNLIAPREFFQFTLLPGGGLVLAADVDEIGRARTRVWSPGGKDFGLRRGSGLESAAKLPRGGMAQEEQKAASGDKDEDFPSAFHSVVRMEKISGFGKNGGDGKEAVTFLIRIKDCIENPTRLMLEM